MPELKAERSTTTDLNNEVQDFSITHGHIDRPTGQTKETVWDYPNASRDLGYYKGVPELKKSVDTLAIWTVGKGVEADERTKALLELMRGWGEDNFITICKNLIVQKKVFGDAYAEIIRNDTNDPINIKPLYTGDMRVKVNQQGIITGYEQRSNVKGSTPKSFKTGQILHLSNDRVANEIHGTSVVESVKWIIDAKQEALRDERTIKHRELALGVLYIDTDNTTRINHVKQQYANAIKNGEVLVLPKDVAEIKDTGVSPKDRIQWLQYLDSKFYEATGVPKSIVNPEGFTEAGAKVGYMTFDPIFTAEQTELEADILNQIGLEVKFNRPPSLTGIVAQDEAKNTGQVGVQPNEVTATATRTE